MREFQALSKQRENAQQFQVSLTAAIRADIHNTAGKSFDRHFDAGDFMPGAKSNSVEERARELMAQGYEPAAAVAMASSSQTREQRLHIVKSTIEASEMRKSKKKRRAKPAG